MLLGAVLIVAGCGSTTSNGSGSANLDCSWLASDNCWKMTASEASCLPPSNETGVLSSDNATCTYASGAVVTFAPPLMFPISDKPNWNFTVQTAGQTCMHYQDNDGGISLTVGSDTFTEGTEGSFGLKVTCPGGLSYSNSNALALLSCNADSGASLGGLPGDVWSSTGDGVTFGLISTSSTSNELSVFNCSK